MSHGFGTRVLLFVLATAVIVGCGGSAKRDEQPTSRPVAADPARQPDPQPEPAQPAKPPTIQAQDEAAR